jgi:hypothetical protein
MIIRRIAPLSMAKLQAILMGLMGLLIGAFTSLFALLAGAGTEGGMFAMLLGAGAIIVFPILNAVIGFIGGAIGALLFNLAASLSGGLEVDAE